VTLSSPDFRERRLLLLAPTSRDASITENLLGTSGILVETVSSAEALFDQLELGAAAIFLPEEALVAPVRQRLRAQLLAQPPWSDLPVLVLTRRGADSAETREAVRTLGNVTLLERPLQVATLLSAVRTAIRARDRQYQISAHLAELARSEEALRLADRRKDEFLATLGHELRNPLAPLQNGLLLIRSLGLEHPVVERMTASMERQVHHLARLVDDLLEVSRITRGLIEIEREVLDLQTVLRSTLESCQPLLAEAGHEVTVDLAAEPLFVCGDAVRLTQAFSNLLTNAAKYTDAGGRISVTLGGAPGRARVSVRDTGIGIPAAHLGSIFDMFTQVDRSNRRAQGGLGIGLTLVRSLVEMHGGRVEAKSDGAGTGSEFIVELPLHAAPRVAASAPAEATQRLPDRRILIVDDNIDAADTLAALLRQLGAVAATAYSGREALDAIEPFRPEVILLDIGMPGMDGYEAARRIRARTPAARLLLIALTGWGQEQDFERSLAAGFDHHLVKPVELSRLRDLLAAV
jgi:signal transduction histidine kinase